MITTIAAISRPTEIPVRINRLFLLIVLIQNYYILFAFWVQVLPHRIPKEIGCKGWEIRPFLTGAPEDIYIKKTWAISSSPIIHPFIYLLNYLLYSEHPRWAAKWRAYRIIICAAYSRCSIRTSFKYYYIIKDLEPVIYVNHSIVLHMKIHKSFQPSCTSSVC